MALPLSVLDLIPIASGSTAGQSLAHTMELAKHVDSLGYTRYWIAEHHNTGGLASSSPEIALALVGSHTRRIRIGSGGVMLPNHSPLKVAENFRTLEALYPGRVDLGLGRAPGTDQFTALALRRTMDRLGADDFPQRIQELQAYAGEAEFPEDVEFDAKIVATPEGVPLPPIWLLSSSGYGAVLAAKLGRGLAFAHHFSPAGALGSMQAYRTHFKPSKHLSKPYAILTVSVICAETEARADALAKCVDLMWVRFHRGERGPLPSPEEAAAYRFNAFEQEQIRGTRKMLTVGTVATVKAKLEGLVAELGADELMVTTHLPVHADRLKSYELLAGAFGVRGN